jgi:glutamate synthase (NADPH/NADH) small chain
MGKPTGFLEIERHDRKYAPVADRVKDFREFVIPLSEKDTRDQAARCMDCGIPYCHGTGSVAPGTPGCPVNNQIPDFNDLVYNGNWEEAARNLHSTNNFPEFTGRICPAPCEASCTLNIDDNPVTIKTIECAIVDRAWDNGWVKPRSPPSRPARRSPWSAPARPAWPARSSSRAPVTTSMCSRSSQGRRPAALRHSRLQDGKGHHRPPRGADGRRRRDLPHNTPVGGACAGAVEPQDLLKAYDAVALTGGAEARATCRFRAATSTASTSRWNSCRSRTAASATNRSATAKSSQGQARGRDRRRRHRLRLRRHLDPPGREVVTQFEIMPRRPSARTRR